MQGDTIFLLVFIFILLIAVGIIGVLCFMYVSKYDESNTFYKNLLEIIKDNPSLSNDLEDKLLNKDFDISDVSTSQRDLSNIFGAKLFNEQQIELVKDNNKAYTDGKLSNFVSIDSDEYKYLKQSYSVLDDSSNSNLFNISSTFFKDIDHHSGITSNFNDILQIMNMNTSSNISLNKEIDILKPLNDLQSFYTISDNDLQITNNSNLKVAKLSICDDSYNNCFELSVDSNKRLVGKSTDDKLEYLQNSKHFVFAEDTTTIYLPNKNKYDQITIN